jgi:hypothetical protein
MEDREHNIAQKKEYNQKNKEKISNKKKVYRESHKEHIVEYQKQYSIDNHDELLAKGRSYYQDNKEIILDKRKRHKKENVESHLLRKAKERSKDLGLPFVIVESDIVIPEFCPILGIPLKIGERKRHDGSPTLDRIIPELGYVPGNIAVISWKANMIKSVGTADEHEKIAAWIRVQTRVTK